MAPPRNDEHGLCECRDCGQFQRIGLLRPGQVAACERCGALLRRRRFNSLSTTCALSCAGLLLLLVAGLSPLLSFRLAGQERVTSLLHLPVAFEDQNMPQMAIVVLATTMLAPFLRLSVTILLLGSLTRLLGRLSRGTLIVFARLREVLAPWAMIEVFLLGLFVAYTRLAARATVEVGIGLYALGALVVVSAWADCWLDEHAMWEAIGREKRAIPLQPQPVAGRLIGCDCCGLVSRGRVKDACRRCDVPLRERRPQSFGRTWALLVTAAVLYVPANFYPILTLKNLGYGAPSTIMGGVRELIEYRLWPLAALVFLASILVPTFKLVALALLLVMAQRGSAERLPDRTRLYRLVDFIGRWSMIDVFMLSVLTALVRMGALASVTPNVGAVAFAGVVVTTMLAALSFDPRLMWDAAETRMGRKIEEATA